jgi:diguanylate cyclase (GGDEF)-like protein
MAPSLLTTKRETVLLVTDCEDLAEKTARSLGDSVILNRTASVAEALSTLTFNMPGLVIADADLTGRSGVDLLKNIRMSPRTRLIPFIVILSKTDPAARIMAFEAGADACMESPFILEELKALVLAKISTYREFYLMSITDELTRLFNRKELIKRFNEDTGNDPLNVISLVILDIDFFKRVNDLYGHQTGDRVLKRLAEMLHQKSTDFFFPARFGGEEFVILLSGMNADVARKVMDRLLEEFSAEAFEAGPKKFHVTFSAGVAEYPSMASNISELLSRADQALYAAKEEGRNRIYTFSPLMARNDKFWEYLKASRGVFVDSHGFSSITKLPWLPQLLETISNLDFYLVSLGVLFIRLVPVFDMEKIYGIKNLYYDIESISIAINRSAEMIYPSDFFLGHTDIFGLDFILFFPSMMDLSVNEKSFQGICDDICKTIRFGLAELHMDIAHSSGIVQYDRMNPHSLYRHVREIQKRERPLFDKRSFFQNCLFTMSEKRGSLDFHGLFSVEHFFHVDTLERGFTFVSLTEAQGRTNLLGALLEASLPNADYTRDFLKLLSLELGGAGACPLLLPWVTSFDLREYCAMAGEILGDREIIVLINENHLPVVAEKYLDDIHEFLPHNISLGIDNCFIGSDILGYLSAYDFSVLLFSENIMRRIHCFKDRITILSGLTVFLDQVSIPAIAKNIQMEEEFHVTRDLHISYAQGQFITSLLEKRAGVVSMEVDS